MKQLEPDVSMTAARRRLVLAATAGILAMSASQTKGQTRKPGRALKLGMLMPTAAPIDGQNASTLIPLALERLGYVAGRDLVVERRFAEGRFEKLDALAADLVQTGPDVIVTVGLPPVLAARRATSKIPIVFYGNFDPLAAGVVTSLARPGGNVTGVLIAPDGTLAAKRLELLAEFVPKARRIAFLASGDRTAMELQIGEARKAAEKLGIDMPVVSVRDGDYNEAFASIIASKPNGLFVAGSTFFLRDRATIIALAAKHQLPATYEWREHVESGGLMSYGSSLAVTTARAADFVDRIFRGAKPADIPVEQPTGFELSLNMKTARSLGLKPAPALLMRAQTVIE